MRPFVTANRFIQAAAAAAVMLFSLPASAAYFQTDFESGLPTEITGVGYLDGTQGYGSLGFGSQFVRYSGAAANQPITLTLTNLPAHAAISLDFFLAIIDSWDGNGDGVNVVAPDYMNITVDGTPIFTETFENSSVGGTTGFNSVQSYNAPSGVTLARYADLGFTTSTPYWYDSAYNMGLDTQFDSIAHSGSSLTISWFANGSGWQGSTTDESWALDNIAITLLDALGGEVTGGPTEVPEPATAAMFLGLSAFLIAQYRRRRHASLAA